MNSTWHPAILTAQQRSQHLVDDLNHAVTYPRFGERNRMSGACNKGSSEMTVEKTERKAKNLHAELDEMIIKLNKVLDILTLNKIDVSHLRITGTLGN